MTGDDAGEAESLSCDRNSPSVEPGSCGEIGIIGPAVGSQPREGVGEMREGRGEEFSQHDHDLMIESGGMMCRVAARQSR